MYIRTYLALMFGGLLTSILVVSGAALFATTDLANRIATVDQGAFLTRHLSKIEEARRDYQSSTLDEHLELARDLLTAGTGEIAELGSGYDDGDPNSDLIMKLEDSFRRYGSLLDAYAVSEQGKAAAGEQMSIQLASLKSMAATLKGEKEKQYHRAFAASISAKEAEERLKTAFRVKALANALLVLQMSIERDIALFRGGDPEAVSDIAEEIEQIAELADRIRQMEGLTSVDPGTVDGLSLPDRLMARSNQFQIDFSRFRLATNEQEERARDMADVAREVTGLIQKVNAFQTQAAVRSSGRTVVLSVLGVVSALVLGTLAALVVRNRLIIPLTAITKTMEQMSGGELSLVVPGHERKDELGKMAHALEVFRQNSLKARRLAAENIYVERRLAEEKAEGAVLEQSLSHEKELNAQQRRFVSLLSHEFRTPLAIIDGHAQKLIRKGDEATAAERTTCTEKIREAVIRLIGLMESVLSSASLEAGQIEFKPKPMDLKSLIMEACNNQQHVSANHRIDVDIDDLPESYKGDPKLLHQVVSNLLSNAVKYSPKADRVDVRGVVQEGFLEISVRDFGLGVPEDEVAKLFERFFRASTSTGIQGTGIGLNLVKALVEMHGGDIEVSSIEGEGSTFSVKLPLKDDRTAAIAAVA